MEFYKLGKSGLKISEIGLGTNNFGNSIGQEESIAVVRQALEENINFIDTADRYGQGFSEEFIGKAIKGRRHDAIIATKFSMPSGQGPNDAGASRYYILKAIEASLRRLDTDYVDLYYVHFPDSTTPIEETLRTLDNLVKTGKVRYIACSNFAAWQLCEALWTSKVYNLEPFVAVQSQYNMLDRGIEKELIPCCEHYGVGVIPYSPLAGGFLTGKYERGKPAPAGTRFGRIQNAPPPPRLPNMPRMPRGGPASVLNDDNFDKLEKWQEFATNHNHTVEELAIAWLLSHSCINSVIAGATTPQQVSAHVAAANWKLTTQELTDLEQLMEFH